MSVEEEEPVLCEEWISLWIDTALGFNITLTLTLTLTLLTLTLTLTLN
jgi:hypothetical protein